MNVLRLNNVCLQNFSPTFQQFFIDHTSRSTTFIDPRLPIETPFVNPNKLPVPLARRRSRSAGEEEIRPDTIARVSGYLLKDFVFCKMNK